MKTPLPDFSALLASGDLERLERPPKGPLGSYFRHYGLDVLLEQAMEMHTGYLHAHGFRLWVQVWTPPGTVRGTLVVVHGYFDHLGLYAHLLKMALSQGFRVVLWDLPGHGLSSGEPAAIDTFATYTRCLRLLLSQLDERALIKGPLIGIGQSTGGAVLATDALERAGARPWQAQVLLAPLVRPCQWPRIQVLHRLASPFIRRIPRYYQPNTTDQAFTDFLRCRDPLQARHLPLCWLTAMRGWIEHVQTLPPAPIPILILQGEADATVDWRWNLEVLGGLFPDASVVRYPGARHHLVNESPALRRAIFEDLKTFLIEQTEPPCFASDTPPPPH